MERQRAPSDFVLTLWTDDATLAARADAAGVDRVGIDIERLGKAERQGGLGTWISPHRVQALPGLRRAMRRARLFARTNPLHDGSAGEVEELIAAGVDVLMLPMFSGADEVERFMSLVDGRAEVVLLLERRSAAEAIDEILAIAGVDEVHVGINDLSLDLDLENRFLVFTHELTERVAERVRSAGRRFGIGGIGRTEDARVPIDPQLVYAQYARLGATSALLARAFVGRESDELDLTLEVARARACLAGWSAAPPARLLAMRDGLARAAGGCRRW